MRRSCIAVLLLAAVAATVWHPVATALLLPGMNATMQRIATQRRLLAAKGVTIDPSVVLVFLSDVSGPECRRMVDRAAELGGLYLNFVVTGEQ